MPRVEIGVDGGGPVARVVAVLHEHVDPAEALDRGVDEAVALVEVGDVGGHDERVLPDRAHVVGHRLESLLAPRREHHVGARARELHRDAASHAGPDPGDDGHLALQHRHVRSSTRLVWWAGANHTRSEAAATTASCLCTAPRSSR